MFTLTGHTFSLRHALIVIIKATLLVKVEKRKLLTALKAVSISVSNSCELHIMLKTSYTIQLYNIFNSHIKTPLNSLSHQIAKNPLTNPIPLSFHNPACAPDKVTPFSQSLPLFFSPLVHLAISKRSRATTSPDERIQRPDRNFISRDEHVPRRSAARVRTPPLARVDF